MDSPLQYVPKTISDILGVVSSIGDISERSSKLNDFIEMLEGEKSKINAFKRELPFCMHLMDDAIRLLKEAEETHCRRLDLQPVEFIPLKENDSTGEDEEAIELTTEDIGIDKTTWLSSAQLWKNDEFDQNGKQNSVSQGRQEEKVKSLAGDSFNSTKGVKAFVPFTVNRTRNEDKAELSVSSGFPVKVCQDQSNSQLALAAATMTTIRKHRRCWSPELHRRFVDALQKLGGSHAATPRKIRELMQVNGLTNDEVKSHLQKYRIHNAKNGPAAGATSENRRPMTIVGGVLLGKDHQYQNSESWKQSKGSPQGPFDSAVGTSTEEEDERSESCGCKNQQVFPSGEQSHDHNIEQS